jgi:hypothetical protein
MEVMKIVFSAGGIEDCDHLFFLCGLGKRIWKEIMGLCFVESILHNWAEILICGKKNLLEESLTAVLCKLSSGAAVHNIWKLRNDIKHANHVSSEKQIISQIK